MKCFYDPTQDAVGLCKSCGRGISHDHLTDMGKGLACRGRCEEDVKSLFAFVSRSMVSSTASNQILKRSSLASYGSGVFMLTTGIIFIATGWKSRGLQFTSYIGIVFLIYGIWTLIRTVRFAGIVAQLPDGATNEPDHKLQ